MSLGRGRRGLGTRLIHAVSVWGTANQITQRAAFSLDSEIAHDASDRPNP